MKTPRVQPTRLVLLGDPVAHSLSPVFQNAALRAASLPVSYEALRVESHDLASVMQALRRESAAGNVTIPHKESILPLCDRLSQTAQRVGAVNTFWMDGTTLVGDNTDVAGAMAAIAHITDNDVREMRCVVLGAGGTAASVLAALSDQGAGDIRIWSRRQDRAVLLIERLHARATVVASVHDAVRNADLIINTTPLGMTDDLMPVDVETLDAGTRVLDAVYRRDGTALVRLARLRGLRAEDGIRMLVEQGAAAFTRWFQVEPDRAAMWHALQAVGVS